MKLTVMNTLIAGGLTLALAVSAGTAAADSHMMGDPIKDRVAMMKTIGWHIKTIGDSVKGEISYPDDKAKTQTIWAHAISIKEMAKAIPAYFPKGTGPDSGKETRALPAIWEKWSEFEASAKTLSEKADAVAMAAGGGDMGAIGAALGDMGKNGCGGCHNTFRQKKE